MVPNETAEIKENPPLLTVKEAAAYLNVPEETVRWWVKRKEIPFRKAGRHTRFVRSELDEWTKNAA